MIYCIGNRDGTKGKRPKEKERERESVTRKDGAERDRTREGEWVPEEIEG